MKSRLKTQVLEIEIRRNGWMLVAALVVIGVLIFGLAATIVLLISTPKGHPNCASFISQSDRIYALNHDGDTWLDRNHDGIPCNEYQ